MAGIEPGPSGFKSHRSANFDTATAQMYTIIFKWAIPTSVSLIFGPFPTNNCYNKLMWRMSIQYTVRAGIQTNDFQNMSLVP